MDTLEYLFIKEGSLYVLFVKLITPKPPHLSPHSWYCSKALDEEGCIEVGFTIFDLHYKIIEYWTILWKKIQQTQNLKNLKNLRNFFGIVGKLLMNEIS